MISSMLLERLNKINTCALTKFKSARQITVPRSTTLEEHEIIRQGI